MSQEITLYVPDFGAGAAEVIELMVAVGDTVAKDDTLFVLESEKSAFDVPADAAGVITQLMIAEGDSVSQGDVIGMLRVEVSEESTQNAIADTKKPAKPNVSNAMHVEAAAEQSASQAPKLQTPPISQKLPQELSQQQTSTVTATDQKGYAVYAGPAVRKLARKMGVDLQQVQNAGYASGLRGRIVKDDVYAYVKERLSGSGAAICNALPEIDFAAFGKISTRDTTTIERITAQNMSRAWHEIPHVTHMDSVDITELDAARKAHNQNTDDAPISLLALVTRALAECLSVFPRFNTSLSADGKTLVEKHYRHIGIAVDTPHGLMVPVLRDADTFSAAEITAQIRTLAAKARDKKLAPKAMQGASMSITSLGSIGGQQFTPIVNWPEVAILGLTPAAMQPVWTGEAFEPRLMQPLMLSYDHRVINGADAARFVNELKAQLAAVAF